MKRVVYLFLIVVFAVLGFVLPSVGAPNGVLLEKRIDLLYRMDGKMTRDVMLKYEPFNKKGLAYLSELSFNSAPFVKTKFLDVRVNDRKVPYRVVKKRFAPPYGNYFRYSIALRRVSPLDIVTIKYRQIFEFAPDGYLWGSEKLSETVRIKKIYLRFRLPVGVKLKYNKPAGFSFSDEKRGNLRVIRIEAKNIPAEYKRKVLFVYSSFSNWKDLNRWIRSKVDAVLGKTLTKGDLLGMDPLGDKWRVIRRVVERLGSVNLPMYNELPTVKPPLTVWKCRRGSLLDNSIFVLSALRRLGINCSYFFVGRRYFLKDYPPSPALLEKMLVRFTIGGKVHWYVPPYRVCFDDFPASAEQGREALAHVTIENLPLSPPEENYNELVAHVGLFTNGSVKGDIDVSVSGYWDKEGYNWLKDYSYRGSVQRTEDGYVYFARYVAEFSGNKAVLTVPAFRWHFLDMLKKRLPLENGRRLILPSTFMLKEVIEIALPKGYKVGYLPKGIEMAYDVGYLRVTFDDLGHGVRVVVLLKVYRRAIDVTASKHLALMLAVMRDRLGRNILLAK